MWMSELNGIYYEELKYLEEHPVMSPDHFIELFRANINSILNDIGDNKNYKIIDYMHKIWFHWNVDINIDDEEITTPNFLKKLTAIFTEEFTSLNFTDLEYIKWDTTIKWNDKRNKAEDIWDKQEIKSSVWMKKDEGIHFYDELKNWDELWYIKLALSEDEYYYTTITSKVEDPEAITIENKVDMMAAYNHIQAEKKYIKKSCELIDTKYTDDRTWLYNESFAKEFLNNKEADASFIFFDIADFKHINDRYWHVMWDKVLASLWKILRESMRNGDFAVRVGWDEMWLIISNNWERNLEVIADNLQKVLDKLDELLDNFEVEGIKISVVSNYAISTPKDFKDLEKLKLTADKGLKKWEDWKRHRAEEFVLKTSEIETFHKFTDTFMKSERWGRFALLHNMGNIHNIEQLINVYKRDNYTELLLNEWFTEETINNTKIVAEQLWDTYLTTKKN